MLREYLAGFPADTNALTMMVQVKLDLREFEAAEGILKTIIGMDPDNDYLYYLHAKICLDTDRDKEAEAHIKHAISIDPQDADYYALHAAMFLDKKEFDAALERANEALAVDPEHVAALNLRTNALVKLGRKEEGFATIDKALERDAQNPYTHSNYGWAELERGDPKKALEHFRSALQIDSQFGNAKAGLVEALKARYLFYRLFLQYRFWLSRQKGKFQGALIIGLYIGYQIVLNLADDNPQLRPFLTPLIVLYISFALLTWIMEPLSNLFLRLNVYGRYALTEDEIKSSNIVGSSLALGLLGGVGYLISGDMRFVGVLFYGVSMMIPLSQYYGGRTNKGRNALRAFAIGLGISGALALALAFAGAPLFNIISIVYLGGLFIYQWVAAYFALK